MNGQEYNALTTSDAARQAEARVWGVLRGGYVVDGRFLTCTGAGYLAVSLAEVRDLRFAPYS